MIALDFGLNIARAVKQDAASVNKSVDGITKSLQMTQRYGKTNVKQVNAILEDNKTLSEYQKTMLDLAKKSSMHDEVRTDHIAQQVESQGKLNNLMNKFESTLSTVTRLYLTYSAARSFIDFSNDMDDVLTRNMKTFGNYTDTLNAFNHFQNKIANGEFFGNANEYMAAAQTFARKGIQFTEQMQAQLNDVALYSGGKVDDVANTIAGAMEGNFEGLADLTGHTERSLRMRFSRYEGDTKRTADAVMNFMNEQTRLIGAASRAPKTFTDYWNQMKTFFKLNFFQQIFGTTADPNSFVNMVKNTLEDVTQFFLKNADTIRKVASAIGSFLKFVWSAVGDFISMILRTGQKIIDATSVYLQSFKERTAGMLLYLSLIKGDILKVLKAILIGYLAFKTAILTRNAFVMLSRFIEFSSKSMNSFRKNLTMFVSFVRGRVIPAIMRMNLAFMANPYVLLVMAIVAALVLVVYYWDEITAAINNTSDSVLLFIAYFNPVIGLTLILIKYWREFKQIAINVVDFIRFGTMNLWHNISEGFKTMKKTIAEFINSASSFLSDLMPDWMKDFGKWMLDSLKSVGSKIKDFLTDLVPDWIKNFSLKPMLDQVIDVTRKAADEQQAIYEARNSTNRVSDPAEWTVSTSKGDKKVSPQEVSSPSSILEKVSLPSSFPTTSNVPSSFGNFSGDSSNSSSNTTISSGAIQIHVHGDSDPKKIAEEVLKEIRKRENKQIGLTG